MKKLTIAAAALGLLALQRIRTNSYSFADKVVLITGGTRGLGLAMARQLAAQGARLTVLARDEAEVARAATDLRSRGADVLALDVDVRSQEEFTDAITQTVERWGRLDVLINNAGIIQSGPLAHMTNKDFDDAMDTHFWGPWFGIQAALPHFRRQGEGRIVNISSIAGKVAVPHLAPYSASKHALVGLSNAVRAELAHENITVTTIIPGLLRTGSHYNALFKGQHERELAWFATVDSLPVSSIDAERAAHQALEACRRGVPEWTISIQAQFATKLNGLLPNVMARVMALMNTLLPAATDRTGDEQRTGWQSRSKAVPSALTRLSDRATVELNGLQGHAPEEVAS